MTDLPGPPSVRKLTRSRSDRVIAGICGGLARYLGVDTVILRIAFVVLAIAGGGGILLYVVAWILVPEGDEVRAPEIGTPSSGPHERPPSSAESVRLIFGGVLIAIGALLLLGISIPKIAKYLWPLALIALGVAIIVQAATSKR